MPDPLAPAAPPVAPEVEVLDPPVALEPPRPLIVEPVVLVDAPAAAVVRVSAPLSLELHAWIDETATEAIEISATRLLGLFTKCSFSLAEKWPPSFCKNWARPTWIAKIHDFRSRPGFRGTQQ